MWGERESGKETDGERERQRELGGTWTRGMSSPLFLTRGGWFKESDGA